MEVKKKKLNMAGDAVPRAEEPPTINRKGNSF
jgi:hypothetical protein